MISLPTRLVPVAVMAACAAAIFAARLDSAAPACDPDNGGITLPSGFCALVAADNLGEARHIAVAPNGDVYVALMRGAGARGSAGPGGVVAMHDGDGDGRFETKEMIPSESTTGVALRNGYLYVAHPRSIQRYKMTAGQLKPSGEPETIVGGVTLGCHRLSAGLAEIAANEIDDDDAN